MISDILSDSVHAIRDYLNVEPETYAPVRGRIEKVLDEMKALRELLDTPPGGP